MATRVSALVKRKLALVALLLVFVIFFVSQNKLRAQQIPLNAPGHFNTGKSSWTSRPLHYPVDRQSARSLPSPIPQLIPKIQYAFGTENSTARNTRLDRLQNVKSNFTHAWDGYKQHAWMSDELKPLSGGSHNPFGGWAATLVDTLDTLWIMGLDTEFDQAVRAIEQIDFSSSSLEEINVFETTIRYLGGFLAAYDLSGGKYPSLLRKAVELGDMLYVAFDTPNHLPITRWKLQDARNPAIHQTAQETVLVAEIGSLTLEFTRLSQLSGNPKYYDAVQRIMDVFASQQDDTKIPGMWPIAVNAKKANFTEYGMFTIGGMADSLYEYLPKEYLLLGGGSQQYRDLYIKALSVMKKAIFFRPMTKEGSDILLPGNVASDGTKLPSGLRIEPKVQHLGCFAGGMVGLAARAFSLPQDLTLARQLVEGCLWAYENSASGIMPESMFTTNCPTLDICDWDETLWHKDLRTRHPEEGQSPDIRATISKSRLTPGITKIEDRRYILRPEAIESVFILYRLTGDETLMDRAWNMFQTIVKYTQTGIAHAALDDCVAEHPEATRADRMESFWLAETLKYFYLIFESPDVVSLDEYVLNTEAHPLRRPK